MSIQQAVTQLLEIEALRKEGVLDADKTLAVAMSRVGGLDDQRILAGPLSSFLRAPPDAFGPPLHSMIIVGRRLHHLEVEYGEVFAEALGEAIALFGFDMQGEGKDEHREKGKKEGRRRWREVASKVYGVALD